MEEEKVSAPVSDWPYGHPYTPDTPRTPVSVHPRTPVLSGPYACRTGEVSGVYGCPGTPRLGRPRGRLDPPSGPVHPGHPDTPREVSTGR